MNFLELAKAYRREAGIPGTGPTTVVGQTGQLGDLVAWLQDTWRDIQTDHSGHWRWLRRSFTLDTVASDRTYAYGDCTDVLSTTLIDRFNAWRVNDKEDPPRIYRVSSGVGNEGWMTYVPWEDYGISFRTGTQNEGPPQFITIDPQDNLVVGPTPDGIYRITGDYWRGPQELALDADEPECPSQFHMVIVWLAMERYGLHEVSEEALAKASRFGTNLMGRLERNQGAWMRFRMAGPLA